MEIEIRSWDKYNPKRDQKSYTWLRLNNDILTNPDLYALEPLEKHVWVLLLCEASKKNHPRFRLNLAWFSEFSRIEQKEIERIISKIEDEGLISIIKNSDTELRSCAVVTKNVTTPTNERTDVRTNVRTYVLSNSKKSFEPTLIVEGQTGTDLAPEEISSAIGEMISRINKTPLKQAGQA